MSRRLIRSSKRSTVGENVDPLTEVRRHGWLHDYHMELDQGPDRSITSAGPDPFLMQRARDRNELPTPPVQAAVAPVVVNVNINLGDILRRIASGDTTATEALEEMVRPQSRQQLTEGADDALYKDGDQFYVVRQQERFMPRSQGWLTGMKFEITKSGRESDLYNVKFLVGVGGASIRRRLLHKAVERGDVRKI